MAPLYSRDPRRLARQIVADLVVVCWCVWWCRAALGMRDSLAAAATSGQQAMTELDAVAGRVASAATRLDGIPLVGSELSQPISDLATALDAAAGSGSDQLSALADTFGWVAALVFAVPVAFALLAWLPSRFRFARASLRARAVRSGQVPESLLALQALIVQSPRRVAAVADDPVADWRIGDPSTVRRLANLHLRDLGLPGLVSPALDRPAQDRPAQDRSERDRPARGDTGPGDLT